MILNATSAFRPLGMVLVAAVLCASAAAQASQGPAPAEGASAPAGKPAIVYMTTDISPAGMMAVYKALGRTLPGKVAVKLSTGEPGGDYYLHPALIKDLVQSVKGTIVECNTAYGGQRINTAMHKKVAKDHGFTDIAEVDIMDESGSISLSFPKGSHIQEDFVGSHFANYDSFLVLSHFKGHEMGGFGGALKNISIGIASSNGKLWIHSAGTTKSNFSLAFRTEQDAFVESMAEAAGAVMTKLGDKILYINVMNNLSIDCDCNNRPQTPEMADIGILGSTDPVALDKACVDLIYASEDKAKSASLRQRIEKKHGTVILKHAEELGLGTQSYTLVMLNG